MSKSLFQPEAQNDVIWAAAGSLWELPAIWLVLINLAAFLVFGLDKWKAKRKERRESVRRVPEKTLFLLAVLGGSAGALAGMRVFHHKTLHPSFRLGIPLILILQITISMGLWVWWNFIR